MKLNTSITGLADVRAELLRIGTLPRRALDRAAEEVEEFVEAEAGKHSKSGRLVASIYMRRTEDGWEVGHDRQVAPHVPFVHWGARPHEIRARNKRALRYEKDGIWWFWFGPKPKAEQHRIRQWVREQVSGSARVMFKWPKHPGYEGDPWMTRAAALAPRAFDRHLQALMASRKG